MEGSKYVILTPQDDQTSPINEKSIEGENCLTLMKAGDISVYSCKKSNTTP
jgi:hypothetical protein